MNTNNLYKNYDLNEDKEATVKPIFFQLEPGIISDNYSKDLYDLTLGTLKYYESLFYYDERFKNDPEPIIFPSQPTKDFILYAVLGSAGDGWRLDKLYFKNFKNGEILNLEYYSDEFELTQWFQESYTEFNNEYPYPYCKRLKHESEMDPDASIYGYSEFVAKSRAYKISLVKD